MSFFSELKRRNVLRVAAAYGVLSWLLIQVADTLSDTFDLPEWTGRMVVLLLVLGLVPTLIFSWVYELTPEGVRKESDVPPEDSVTAHTAKKLDIAVIVLLVMAMGLFGFDRLRSSGDDPEPVASSGPAVGDRHSESQVDSTDDVEAPVAQESSRVEDERRSLAVLPFTNRSAEADTAFFVDGIHDDLLTQLAKIAALKVISRTSVLEYRDTTKNLREIGQELGVSTIMEGAVQRAGDRVRINAQLIDAETDEHLWAETFDRELTAEGIFELQSELAKAIAGALEATLSPSEQASIEHPLTDDIEALAAYQRARNIAEALFSPEKVQYELQTALEHDPEFVAAWALLARTYLNEWWLESRDPGLRDQAWEAIETGRRLEPDSMEIRIAEGYYHYWGFRDYDRALALLEPLLAERPNDADLHELLGFVNRRAGHFDAALHHLIAALELNPRSTDLLSSVGETYLRMRDLASAERYLDRASELAPTSSRSYQWRGRLDLARGDQAAGMEKLRLAAQDGRLLLTGYWKELLASGDYDVAMEVAGFDQIDQRGVYLAPVNRAVVHALKGEQEAAVALAQEGLVTIREALARDPDNYGYQNALCWALAASGDRSAAIEACERALSNLYDDAFDRQLERTDLAVPLTLVGAKDRVLEILAEVLEAPVGPTRVKLRQDARFAALHDDPGWHALFGEEGE